MRVDFHSSECFCPPVPWQKGLHWLVGSPQARWPRAHGHILWDHSADPKKSSMNWAQVPLLPSFYLSSLTPHTNVSWRKSKHGVNLILSSCPSLWVLACVSECPSPRIQFWGTGDRWEDHFSEEWTLPRAKPLVVMHSLRFAELLGDESDSSNPFSSTKTWLGEPQSLPTWQDRGWQTRNYPRASLSSHGPKQRAYTGLALFNRKKKFFF